MNRQTVNNESTSLVFTSPEQLDIFLVDCVENLTLQPVEEVLDSGSGEGSTE